MIGLIIFIILIFFFVLGIIFGIQDSDSDMWTISFLSGGCLIIFLLLYGGGYYNHIENQEDIKKFFDNMIIYEERAQDLENQFKLELSKYIKHEKEIFNNIGPKNIDIYFVKYPELKSNEVLIKLVDNIKNFRDTIYNNHLKINELKASLRKRKRNPFLFMLPKNIHKEE